MGDTTAKTPNPGAPAAVALGCTCARMDNCHGAGIGGNGARFGWWVSETCPLHGTPPTSAVLSASAEPPK